MIFKTLPSSAPHKEEVSSEIADLLSIQHATFFPVEDDRRENWSGENTIDPFYHNSKKTTWDPGWKNERYFESHNILETKRFFPKSRLPEQKHRIQNSERLDKYFK